MVGKTEKGWKKMALDIPKEIRRAVDTGSVVFGYRSAEKNILKGKGEIVIISRNCPPRLVEKIRQVSQVAEIPFFEFEGTGLELGSICGKPFLVSALLVLDKGKSKVLELSKALAKPKAAKQQKKRKPVTKKPSKKGGKAKAKKEAKKKKGLPASKTKKTESRKR